MRQIVRLPFADGIERAAGSFLTEPTTFRDLRDVHLVADAIRVRRGLESKATVAGVTDVIAVHPLRSSEQSVVVTYNATTRDVALYRATVHNVTLAVTLTFAGTLWTLPIGSPFPRVVVTDSFGLAFVAHDEPTYGFRQATKVYDPAMGTIGDVLYNNDALFPMNFRGVSRWLNYVVGWGYGHGVIGPPDQRTQPNWLRLSMPGDPERWRPEFYLQAGQRGEAIVGTGSIPAGLIVAKQGELYRVLGTSQLDFDIEPIDQSFGSLSHALGVAVGSDYYFWSAEGPRVTSGGASVPIGENLDLFGELPENVLASTDYRYAFAVYHAEVDEVEWVFPAAGLDRSWSFVYNRGSQDGRVAWHYREYKRLLRSAGILSGNVAFDLTDPANTPVPIATSLALNGGGWYAHDLDWQNLNIGFLSAGAVVEVWASGGTGSFVVDDALPWAKVDEVTAVGAVQSLNPLTIGDATTGQPWRHVALRYRLPDGSHFAAWQSTNPMDWPATSRISVNVSARPEIANVLIDFDGVAGYTTPIRVDWENTNLGSLDSGAIVEIWSMGADSIGGTPIAPDTWQLLDEVVAAGATQFATGLLIGQQARHIALRYRIDGKFYSHSNTTADPFHDWPFDSVDAIALDGPRPVLSFAWDDVGGIPRSPGTLTVDFPDAALAPNGAWTLEVYRTVWYQGIGYDMDAIPPAAWVLQSSFSPTAWNPQPPATQDYGPISSLNSSYKILFAARMLFNGSPRPDNYSGSDPLAWPDVSRITVDSL